MRRIAIALPLAVLLSIACGVTAPTALAPATPSSGPTPVGLPKPIPQPITRTSPGAQVAWMRLTERDSGLHSVLAGIDATGAIVAQFDPEAIGARGIVRSTDGASLYAFVYDRIETSSALDGKLMRSYAARHRDDTRTLLLMAPGWVKTDLGGPNAGLTIDESIPNLVTTIDAQRGSAGLQYLDYQGQTVAW